MDDNFTQKAQISRCNNNLTTCQKEICRFMNILHTVQTYPPAKCGMAEVVKQLSERLVAMGHCVTVATEYNPDRTVSCTKGVNVVPFMVSGNMVNGLKGDVRGYERFLLESRFDIMVNFAAQQWATDIALPLLPRIAGRKVFVPTGFSCLYSRRYRAYFKRMPEWLNSYDMNVFHSDRYRDIAFTRQHGVSRTVLIPNGAAADEFKVQTSDILSQLSIPQDHGLILLVGSHSGLKGHGDAMNIFSRADICNATLLIVGNEPQGGCGASCRATAHAFNVSDGFRAKNLSIIVTTLSRKDVVAAYHAADLFLFPSNIECSPIVLFECMASRTPFLTTDVGNSAEIIEWSAGAGMLLPTSLPDIIPDYSSLKALKARLKDKVRFALGLDENYSSIRADIPKSAELLRALWRDDAKRIEMARAGFRAWQERFTWEKISGEYETLYRRLLEGN